jgi:flagellar hook-associated protein 3 FlgL
MDRISSFGQSRQLIAQALKVQSNAAATQMQVSTGVKSTSYAGVADQSRRIVSLESSLARADKFIANGEIVGQRVQTMYSAVSSVSDLANSARTLFATALSGDASSDDEIRQEAQGLLQEVMAALNQSFDGSYLFAGSRSNTPAVSLEALGPADLTTPNTSYYQGDGEAANYRASEDVVVEYGVGADDPGFEKLIRVLNGVANAATTPIDQATYQAAYDLATEALEDLSTLQIKLSATAETVERQVDANTEYQLYAEALLSNVKEVDVAAATAELSAQQTQLEASYQVLAALQKLSLLEFL